MRSVKTTKALAAAAIAVSSLCGGCATTNQLLNSAADQCLQQARQIPQTSARRTAEDACRAVKSGNVDKVKSAARRECLDAVSNIPDSHRQQRDAARAHCEAIK
jgi:aspartokinase